MQQQEYRPVLVPLRFEIFRAGYPSGSSWIPFYWLLLFRTKHERAGAK